VRIDLHTHSTASDGTDTPAELIAAARASGLDVIAVTDHDTTGGWEPARAAVSEGPAGLTLVTGTEFSCVHIGVDRAGAPVRISLHLLGYLFDPDHEGLRAERIRLRAARLARGEEIVSRMVADGVPISWARVAELADGGAVGRPHIGRALVEAGLVPDVDAAFADLLSSRSRYYVGTPNTDVLSAIALVRAAGGVPVFAHPLARRRGRVVGDDVIVELAAAGLAGLEVDHPDHAPADRIHLAALAAELDLVRTGSSDYHGTNKPTRLAAEVTAPDQYERLVSLATAAVPFTG
jgi:predicted metal-dependent phosphoesterase TrpH